MSAVAPVRTTLLTLVVLVAFAGNSLLCRLALVDGAIDPLGFTALRIASGALALWPFLRRAGPGDGGPRGAATLLAYAVAFSLAYVSLDAGVGALVLFGAVQVTMIASGWRAGERPTVGRAVGFAAAVAGLGLLALPGADAPPPGGAALMALAGVAWGAYSLAGRGARSASGATARHFALATPLALVGLAAAAVAGTFRWSAEGAALAVASGALTSGLGYVLWYAALAGHSATSAAIVQLAVPILAALGGVALLDEALTPRLVAAGALTLGGVAVAVLARRA